MTVIILGKRVDGNGSERENVFLGALRRRTSSEEIGEKDDII